MRVIVTRKNRTVVASTEAGVVLRTHECLSIPAAASLALNLTGNPDFASWWAAEDEPKAAAKPDPWLDRYPYK